MILRHLDTTYDVEKILSLPPYDAFVYQHGHGQEAIAEQLMAERKECWHYFNILSHPDPSWTNVPWHKLVSEIVPKLSIYDELGGTGSSGPRIIKGWGGGRPLWDYSRLDSGKLMALAQEINSIILPGTHGIFLDLTFLRMKDWMMNPASDYFLLDSEDFIYHERRMRRLLQLIRSVTGLPTLSNGDRRQDIGDLYLEYADWNWEIDTTFWNFSKETVLSVDAAVTPYVDKLIDLHRANPKKWIAFTGHDEAAIDEAYGDAVL